jgi:hypothetical protein
VCRNGLMRKRPRKQEKTWNKETSFTEEVCLIVICVVSKVDSSGDSPFSMNTNGTGVWYPLSFPVPAILFPDLLIPYSESLPEYTTNRV